MVYVVAVMLIITCIYISHVVDRPTIKQLQGVMRIKNISITPDWIQLGLELLDSHVILDSIKANHRNDVSTCCRVMFEKWLEKTPDASWSQLVTALNNIESRAAACAISKLFKPGT